METINNEILQYENGSPLIEHANYDKTGRRLFRDSDGKTFTENELFRWLHDLVHDEDYLEDDMITDKMIKLHKEAMDKGFITYETP